MENPITAPQEKGTIPYTDDPLEQRKKTNSYSFFNI
jgi:hypothetical protein